MSVQPQQLDAFADEMLGVFRRHELVRRSDLDIAQLTLDEAYAVQDRVIAARTAGGERQVGWKIGCTSRAIQQQFGLSEPIYARIMHPHIHADKHIVSLDACVDCGVEPELVFRIGARLEGTDIDDETLRAAIASASAGIEIHNYRFFHGRPTSQELIASNGIHAALVVSNDRAHVDDDLTTEGVGLFVNGVLVCSAINAEVMGGPLVSLRWLVNRLTESGRRLEPGQVVIPGSAVNLVAVHAGDHVEARFTRFGRCEARFADG